MSTEIVSKIPFLVRSACQTKCLTDDARLNLDKINCGYVEISLPLTAECDLDYRGLVRGSAIYYILETSLQACAISVGSTAETLNFCCNAVKYTAAKKIRAVCKICHHGRMTLVAEGTVYDENDTLLATVLTTMFVVETIKDIPRKW